MLNHITTYVNTHLKQKQKQKLLHNILFDYVLLHLCCNYMK